MPIDINAPDGTIARFPDGMSDDAITAVMRRYYPPPGSASPAAASPTAPAGSNNMATFHLTDQSGAVYEVQAPDENAAVAALVALHGGSLPVAAQQAPAANAAPPGGASTAAPADQALSYGDRWNQVKAIPGQLDEVMRSLANGMTFGLADRAAAGMGALTGVGGKQGDYAGNLADERAQTAASQAAHPLMNTVAHIEGGLPTALALPGAVPAEA